MGQYYKPVILKGDKKTPLLSGVCYDFGSGAKLMEHSWVGNAFVGLIERFLLNNKMPIVWAGDYADGENFDEIPLSLKKAVLKDNDYYKNDMKMLENEGMNLYSVISYGNFPKLTHDEEYESKYEHRFKTIPESQSRYIVNHDKRVFVDKRNVPKDSDGWKIHPLPLLTCEGNGRGGGDFRGESELVGSWSRDVISIENKKSNFPKDFKEVIFNLAE